MANKKYVVGFFFDKFSDDATVTHVALICKARPEWQKGLWNGIGGHIEEGETPLDAMVREFKEETGFNTYSHEWTEYVTLRNDDAGYELHIFKLLFVGEVPDLRNMDITEPVLWWDITHLPHNKIPNLAWLIPFAFDKTVVIPIVLMDRGR